MGTRATTAPVSGGRSSNPGGSSSTSRSLAVATFCAGDEPIWIIPSFHLPGTIPLLTAARGCATVGPFAAGAHAQVPLWVATSLRRRRLCRIVPPEWMDVERLRSVLDVERRPDSAGFSRDLPYRYAEMSKLILDACGATGAGGGGGGGVQGAALATGESTSEELTGSNCDVPRVAEVMTLLEDIEAVRMDRIRENVHRLSRETLGRLPPGYDDDQHDEEDGRGPENIEGDVLKPLDVSGMGSVEMLVCKPFLAEACRVHRLLSGKKDTGEEEEDDDGNGDAGPRTSSRDIVGRAASASRRHDSQNGGTISGRVDRHRGEALEEPQLPETEDDEDHHHHPGDESSLGQQPPTRQNRIRRFR